MGAGLTLLVAGIAGLGLGVGLVAGVSVVRFLRRRLRDPDDQL